MSRYDRKSKKKEKNPKRRRRNILIAASVFVVLAGIVLMGYFVRIDLINVSGNHYADRDTVVSAVFPKEDDKRLLFAFAKSVFGVSAGEAFSSADLRMTGLSSCEIRVKERPAAYEAEYDGSTLFLSREGVVLGAGMTEKGLLKVKGLSVTDWLPFKKITVSDEKQLSTLSELTGYLEKYGVNAVAADLSETEPSITVASVTVRIGNFRHLEEKIREISEQMEQFRDLKGILHMEDYDGIDAARFYFEIEISPEEEGD